MPNLLMRAAGAANTVRAAAMLVSLVIVSGALLAQENKPGEVDTALVVSVDVSNSVDDRRYQLQMQGIASALEDPAVLDAILSGGKGGILFTMVTWADKAKVSVPWMRIASKEEAAAAADAVRQVPHPGGEFTCVGKMLRFLADKVVTQVPAKATRTIIDVSGDGSDNCNPLEPTTSVRDELVSYNVTVNGLPILEGKEAGSLEKWYTDNVKGGSGSFVLPAAGFEDFGRAIRQKFVVEVSGLAPAGHPGVYAAGATTGASPR